LGKPRINDSQLDELILSKDNIKDEITNLVDAIRLFRASCFRGVIDNVRIVDENTSVIWTYHKPGFHAHRTNEGCCAADSNWLCYVLGNAYEEVGCLGYYQSDGDGHIINYILHDGYYYCIDMMMQRIDSVPYTAVESGDIKELNNSDFMGSVYKFKSIDKFIDYLNLKNSDKQIDVFYRTPAAECHAIGIPHEWRKSENGLWYLNPISGQVVFHEGKVILLWERKNGMVKFTNSKVVQPDWNSI
jgi:hypothetical protein